MKYIIIFSFFFLFVSCDCEKSVYIDKRCQKLEKEAGDHGIEIGVCYKRVEGMHASERKRLHPDPEACKALYKEANKKCDALPPPGPDDIQQLSGSSFGGC